MDAAVRDSTLPDTDAKAAIKFGAASLLLRLLRRNAAFVLTVLIPVCAGTVYYGFIAADVYTSESRFVVRSPERPPQSGLLGDFLESTGITHSEDDTYAVHDFILSRDALKELEAELGVKKSYSNGQIDWFNRFPGWEWDSSFESLYRYYGRQVTVDYDPVSSISVLTVHAFSAQDAYKINETLLEMSERLVNSLNDRSRHDLIQFAEQDVRVATEQAKAASLALLAYRSNKSIFEPNKQAEIQLEGVSKLQEELVSTEAELAQLRKLSPRNPQIEGLQSRAETLKSAIGTEASKVTTGDSSLSARAPAFERLALESDLADKQLGVAFAELETARSEAARKQLYLDRLVQPNLPDKAMAPRRVRDVMTIFMIGLIAWGVASLVLAAIREHAD